MISSLVGRVVTSAVALSMTLAVAVGTASAAAASAPPPPTPSTEIVVKVEPGSGDINRVLAAFPVVVVNPLLASRGIYLLQCVDPRCAGHPDRVKDLAHKIAGSHLGVIYAQPDSRISLADTQFHSWPYGLPTDAGELPDGWTQQPALSGLDLPAAQAISQGDGVVVAVLDTGVDAQAPVLAGHVLPGWNYVDDNADTDDVATGADDNGDGNIDAAAGHGTFVSGMVSLVAPDAQILPERVLDSDGFGNVFIVAQAILDAVDAGADVINISFGTAVKLTSPLINDALKVADTHNVVVVAAAGNDASNLPHYPAATSTVLSVGATRGGTSRDLTSFSDWGDWVAVGAPGQSLVGPVPGGKFVTWSGTSMAAPLVAGQAALVRAVAPRLKGHELADTIRHTALRGAAHQMRFGAISLVPSLRAAVTHH